MVEAAWDEAGNRVEGAAEDGALKACCQTIADARDAHNASDASGASPEPWADRNECCSLLDWSGSMTCTPWGPPVPPALA
jgi:hypothetical protein